MAWLISTAGHKAIDQLRRRALAENKRDNLATLVAPEEDMPVPLDALRPIFTCCHPALAQRLVRAFGTHTQVRCGHRVHVPPTPLAAGHAGDSERGPLSREIGIPSVFTRHPTGR